MEASLPFIATALTALTAVQSLKKPKTPKVIDQGDPESLLKKRGAQREAQRRYQTGRTSTILSGSGTLG